MSAIKLDATLTAGKGTATRTVQLSGATLESVQTWGWRGGYFFRVVAVSERKDENENGGR